MYAHTHINPDSSTMRVDVRVKFQSYFKKSSNMLSSSIIKALTCVCLYVVRSYL